MTTTGHAGLAWRRSSYSGTNGDCVEVAWRASSHSGGNGNCVEVALEEHAVAVRDSKHPAAGHLETGRRSWAAFVSQIDGVDVDRAYGAPTDGRTRGASAVDRLRGSASTTSTTGEIMAMLRGE